jgi:cysteinyl-tRNA synthetase
MESTDDTIKAMNNAAAQIRARMNDAFNQKMRELEIRKSQVLQNTVEKAIEDIISGVRQIQVDRNNFTNRMEANFNRNKASLPTQLQHTIETERENEAQRIRERAQKNINHLIDNQLNLISRVWTELNVSINIDEFYESLVNIANNSIKQ